MAARASAEPAAGRLPSEIERDSANQLRELIAAQVAGDASLYVLDAEKRPHEIALTPALSGLLMEVLGHIGSGDAVTLVPLGRMLSTQQAADILNISRPFFISLVDRGEIPCILVGKHRRISAAHLFSYKKARDAARGEALSDLAGLDAEYL